MNANTRTLEVLGTKLASAALNAMIRLYPDMRLANSEQIETACAAMRVKAQSVMSELLDDARDAPSVTHIAFADAAIILALEGIRSLKATRQ